MDDLVLKPYNPGEVFACMARRLGVRYRYERIDAAETPAKAGTEMRPEWIAALPLEIRVALQEAIVSLESNQIGQAVRDVAEVNPALGSALAGYVERYAYTEVLRAIASARVAAK